MEGKIFILRMNSKPNVPHNTEKLTGRDITNPTISISDIPNDDHLIHGEIGYSEELNRLCDEVIPKIESVTYSILPIVSVRHKPPTTGEKKTYDFLFKSQLRIPGFHGEPKENCGRGHYARCADNHEESTLTRLESCHDRNCKCPACDEGYRYQQAKKVMVKSLLYEESWGKWNRIYAMSNSDRVFTVPRHFEFSLDQEWSKKQFKTEVGIRAWVREINRVIRVSGMEGGTRCDHSHRTTDRAKQEYREACSREDRWINQGLHIWLKKNGIVPETDPKEHYWHLAPHTHVLGYGWLIPSDEFFEKTKVRGREGAVYINITEREKNPFVRDEDYINCVKYLLSHTFLYGDDYRNHDSYSFLGGLSRYGVKGKSKPFSVECPHSDCRKVNKPVMEWVNVAEELVYNGRNGEFEPSPVFERGSGTLHPICTDEVVRYFVTTYTGCPTGKPELSAVKIIDNNPFPMEEKKPPELVFDSHRGYVLDSNHNEWIDPDGNPCECKECKPEAEIIEVEPEEIPEEPFTVETIRYNPTEPEEFTTEPEPDQSELNFMHKKVLGVVDNQTIQNKPVSVDSINGYLRIPVTLLLKLLEELTKRGYLSRDMNPNIYRRLLR